MILKYHDVYIQSCGSAICCHPALQINQTNIDYLFEDEGIYYNPSKQERNA